MKLRVGITGQNGFIGYHAVQQLRLFPEKYEIIPFKKEYFNDPAGLQQFVKSCDAVIHLAAMNRGDEKEIYATNISLVKKLIAAMGTVGVTPHILFSSSTQETRGNLYGNSKKEGAELFAAWAEKNHAVFSHFVIPNVFGPFSRPYYNTVVATFCHQLTHKETPRVDVDAAMNLIYVGDLAKEFIAHLHDETSAVISPMPVTEINVSGLLAKLDVFKAWYFEKGMIPTLRNRFDVNLFNTFRSFANDIIPIYPELRNDLRGTFVEVMKEMTGGQTSFSTTVPGITRGNHYHLRKIERFCVVKGKALIQTRRVGTDIVNEYEVSGEKPAFIDMPIYYTHNIKNIGNEDLLTIFWINELFDPNDPDTYLEAV
ncbi:polysaccharide biosynthesis C-terminal domain-containing protein [Methanocorpusculum bavaricum]|uniref:polysaccharide biosynthesis C-terminal domain-containing protein n=1 Tax=Methanocorpusculum bavaricum TaxID=71518 RepID=UPI0005B2D2A1|nr:NAD-dependent epimerase/dehydratase family protein [Methanocorpusculum bavaricum]